MTREPRWPSRYPHGIHIQIFLRQAKRLSIKSPRVPQKQIVKFLHSATHTTTSIIIYATLLPKTTIPCVQSRTHISSKMQFPILALFVGLSAAQVLQIPTRVGNVTPLTTPYTIKAGKLENFGNREFDRGMKCAPGDTGSKNAVFILEDGATIEDVIIGANALEGIHCLGKCTVRRAWFRDVCEGE